MFSQEKSDTKTVKLNEYFELELDGKYFEESYSINNNKFTQTLKHMSKPINILEVETNDKVKTNDKIEKFCAKLECDITKCDITKCDIIKCAKNECGECNKNKYEIYVTLSKNKHIINVNKIVSSMEYSNVRDMFKTS